MRLKSLMTATACVAALAGATSGAALAGESTGNFAKTGKTTPVANYVMQSICAFSGQNPEAFLPPTLENGQPNPEFEPGRTQSWGQIPKAGRDLIMATEPFLQPGSSCNGHTGFLAGGGSEG